MKQVYELCAYNGRDKLKTVFLLEETDIVKEEFLEDIQNVLASGLVPNLYSADDMARVRDECKMAYKMAGNTEEIPEKMNEFFYRRVQDNLHLVYIVSSTLESFSVACRSFPALINNAAFIFYNPWPNEGLYEVAYRFMSDVNPLPDGAQKAISRVCTEFYDKTMTTLALRIKTTLGRPCDLLPSHYTSFLETYKVILDQKRKDIGSKIEKYKNGILKLEDANETVKQMSAESEKSNEKIQAAKQLAEIKEGQINVKKKTIDVKLEELTKSRKQIEAEKVDATNLARAADAELAKAMPAL